jgi:ribonuclease E
MKKEMLINVLQPEECRIAIVEDGVLEELYVERTSHESYVGNIYKGRIVNIEPSIQAAFVDFGVGRNGFLHVSDVEPTYYRHLEQHRDDRRNHGRGRDRDRDRDRGRRGSRGQDRRDERRPPRHVERQEEQPEPYVEREPDETTFTPDRPPAGPAVPPDDTHVHAEGWQNVETAPEELTTGEVEAGDPAVDPVSTKSKPESGGGKQRRRRRGRGGSRRRGKAAPPAESKAGAGTDASEAPEPERFGGDSDAEQPRPMEGAERRTDEGDEPLTSGHPGTADDDDLFFPREDTPAVREEQPRREDFGRREPAPEPRRSSQRRQPVPAADEDDFRPRGGNRKDRPQERPERDVEVDTFDEADVPFEDFDELDEPQRPSGRRGGRRDDRRGGRGRRPNGRNGFGRPKPPIQEIFKRGQEVIVQVIKEGIGTKGPTLSTYISVAGRYLVLMPSLSRVGVSRKIQDEEQRRRLRDIFNEMQPPRGLGFIIRTAAIDRNKKELQSDLVYLTRLWQVLVRRIRKLKSPAEIYQESDMITRTIRDTFTKDISTIFVDEPTAFQHAQEFLNEVMPRYADRLKLHDTTEPIFQRYGIESEIARIQRRHVPLPAGGSIVIDQTEALVAIDVNSGNFRADNNAEETAYQMNLQAAREIARQLRLRDLGGVIVNDFIDMREEKHRRGVEKAIKDAMKRDRARTKILRMSQFGLIAMTRQRIRPSLKRSVYQDCPYCLSTGQVKTVESMSIDVMRMIQLAAHKANIHKITIRTSQDVANYLLNKKRKEITRLEESGNLSVHFEGQAGASPEMLDFVCLDDRDNEVKVFEPEERRGSRR